MEGKAGALPLDAAGGSTPSPAVLPPAGPMGSAPALPCVDFSQRSSVGEWMDTEVVTAADFAACLADLAVVNRVTLAHRPTFAFLRRASGALPPGAVLRVLDVGHGEGDMLRAVYRWAERRGLRVALAGIDLNPLSTAAAIAATPASMAIAYHTGDVFGWSGGEVDVVISSLFTHHLPDPVLERFIDWMEATARRGWFVNDLRRSRVAWYGFRALSTLAGWHRFVRHDGPVSIARSFRPEDWRARLHGVPARIEPWFPYRLCVARHR